MGVWGFNNVHFIDTPLPSPHRSAFLMSIQNFTENGDNGKFKTEMSILIRFGFISSALLTQISVFMNGCAVKDWR